MNRALPACLLVALLVGACARTSPSHEPTPVREIVVADSIVGRATLAADANGKDLFVAYAVDDTAGTNVYLTRIDATGTTGVPVRVNDRPGDAAAHAQAPAQVRVGPDGSIYVAWITQSPIPGRRFPASDIRFARSTNGGRTFSPAVTVNPDAGVPTSHHFHNLAVGPDGTVYVSWLDGSAKDLADHHAGVTDHGAGHHDHHGGHGSDDGPGTELHVARSVDGGRTFGEPVVVARGTCQCCRTALAIGDSGMVYVAWRHIFEGQERDIALARSTDGGRTFEAPVRVHQDGWQIDGCPHAGPAMALDGAGALHLAWYTGAEDGTGVVYARSDDSGRTFGAVQRMSGPGPISQVGAVAGDHGVWLAWENPLAKEMRVLRVEDDLPDTLEATGTYGLLPALALLDGRHAFAATRNGELVVALAEE